MILPNSQFDLVSVPEVPLCESPSLLWTTIVGGFPELDISKFPPNLVSPEPLPPEPLRLSE